MRLNRRQILQASVLGGLAGTFGGLAPSSSPAATATRAKALGHGGSLDGYEILRSAVHLGRRIQLGSRSKYCW